MMEDKQKKIALELLEDFNKDAYVANQGKRQSVEEFDKERLETLKNVKSILEDFFKETISLEEFKKRIDSLNKQNPYWGFRGINGQMFFNMLYKSSSDKKALKNLLIEILIIPKDIKDAKGKINKIIDFIKISTKEIDKRKLPRVKSVLFFASYFWQIQGPKLWPIFYSSMEQTLLDLGILEQKEDLADYYEEFYKLNMELLSLFKEKYSDADLWFVEHVFWKHFISFGT